MLVLMVVMPVRGLLAMDGFDCGHDALMQGGMQGGMQGMTHSPMQGHPMQNGADHLMAAAQHGANLGADQGMDCCDQQCDCNNCAAVSISLITVAAVHLPALSLNSDFVVMDTTQFSSLETRPLLQPPSV